MSIATNYKPHFMNYTLSGTPFRDVERGCHVLSDNFPEAIMLPRFTKSMRPLLEGMPGLVIDAQNRRLFFDISPEKEGELIQFYDRYWAGDVDHWAISPQDSKGLFEMLDMLKAQPSRQPKLVLFSAAGPLTWGHLITDKDRTACLFNPTLRDIMIKQVAMKAAWIDRKIRQELPGVQTAFQVGEPSLVIFSSAVGTGSKQDIQDWLNEMLGSVEGFKGVHCCANADWTILMEANIDIIHFDAYQFGDKFALFSNSANSFMERGGMIAWGIVPNTDEGLAIESLDSLEQKLDGILSLLANEGVDRKLLTERSFVSTCCDTSNMSTDKAEDSYQMTRQLSERMKQKYPLQG